MIYDHKSAELTAAKREIIPWKNLSNEWSAKDQKRLSTGVAGVASIGNVLPFPCDPQRCLGTARAVPLSLPDRKREEEHLWL